jgi:hypothetical protein
MSDTLNTMSEVPTDAVGECVRVQVALGKVIRAMV